MQSVKCEPDETVYVQNICRICSRSQNDDKNMRYLFDDGPDNLLQEIEFCTGIMFEKHDNYPTQICSECLRNLQIASSFKKLCESADETFHKRNTVEVEIEISPLESTTEVKCETDAAMDCQYEEDRNNLSIFKKNNERQVQVDNLNIKEFRRIHDLIYPSTQKPPRDMKPINDDKPQWICEICSKSCTNYRNLLNHRKTHTAPTLTCDHCSYATNAKSDMLKHAMVHLDVKSFKCSICLTSFRTSSALSTHRKIYHEVAGKIYKCDFCNKQFRDQYKCNEHMETHNSKKRFKCELCQSRFSRRCHWRRHLLTTHSVAVPKVKPGRKTAFDLMTDEVEG